MAKAELEKQVREKEDQINEKDRQMRELELENEIDAMRLQAKQGGYASLSNTNLLSKKQELRYDATLTRVSLCQWPEVTT